jgi:hypothetical protein
MCMIPVGSCIILNHVFDIIKTVSMWQNVIVTQVTRMSFDMTKPLCDNELVSFSQLSLT